MLAERRRAQRAASGERRAERRVVEVAGNYHKALRARKFRCTSSGWFSKVGYKITHVIKKILEQAAHPCGDKKPHSRVERGLFKLELQVGT